jgi:neutral ceramidase
VPDNIVYNGDGSIKSPIDEFNVLYGAAFCGEDPPYLPGYAPADVFPYNACVNVSQMISVINGFFDLTDEEKTLPLAESTRAYVTATRLGPVPIREADGTTTTDDFFIGFFPGETTAMYTEQFRRRAKAELGYQHSMAVGYAQDHEGYLLIPEDWLQGGYEADINIWGPLQGEHIMEQLLVMAGEVLSTDVIESRDPCGTWQIPDYGESTLPTAKPDTSPEAGTLLAANPGYLYSPLYSEEELELGSPAVGPVASVARVQGMVEIAWIGGDPGVDLPLVTLEYQQEDGSWEAVTQPSGRTVTGGPDILLTWTPDPLAPADIEQTHYWYAAWQAVGTQDNKVGLSLGMYRFSVEGQSYTGAAATWPWDTAPYQVLSEPFELTPAAITLGVEGTDIVASIQTGLRGYRLLGMDFASDGGVKLEGSSVTLQITTPDGTDADISVELDNSGGLSRLTGVLEGLETGSTVTVIDIYGNLGTLTL